MSASGPGGCGPGPGASGAAGNGASNPRKFSEKIALHTQRQAEETAAFQEVMMDISSTRLQAQKLRLARTQGPYYGGSLPNVNQIGRNPQDFQGSFPSALESNRSTRHHGLVERVQRDRRFISPVRPYRNRPVDNSPYNSSYLSPPPDPSWRRNWCGNFAGDKSQLFRLPTTALNRTNSDSALHTSVMNPPAADPFTTGGHTLTPQGNRRTGLNDGERARMFPYPVPPIEENMLSEGKLLKPWDAKKLPMFSSRPKSCEVPDINIFTSPEQPSAVAHGVPSALNTGGSLPDLSILHFPSPLPTPLDQDEPGAFPGASSLSGGSSTGNLASTLTQLGINAGNAGPGGNYHQHGAGMMASLQSALSNPSLPSSLSNPNLQSSLSSHSFPASLHSSVSNPSLQSSLHSSLSNPSLQSSLSSSPSSLSSQSLHCPSSLSSQSLHSSLSSSSLQSGGGNPAYCGGLGGASLSTSPRRRAQLSPLILPMGVESRRHHAKQFSPTISPTLSSITQGVPLDTSKLPLDQRLPPFPLSQNQQRLQTQQMHNLRNSISHQASQQQHYATQQRAMSLNTLSSPLIKSESPLDHCSSSTSCPSQLKQEVESDQRRTLPQLQQISHNLATDLGLYNDALFNSLLDDPYLSLQLTGKSNQQFSSDPASDGLSLNHSGLSCHGLERTHSVDLQDANQNQSHVYGQEARHNVPNIILTGDSPPGLSKEIASALSHVPGFEMDPFSLDDPLRMDPLALDMLDGDLMLADPAVEDSFRSDRLK
ncbi:CREB-regulated transcription coactivator 2-like isoform X2 [Eucyclogobius newberryi]|uniref:CREB-regulated transcription coactivator 2-like isoform X2 n=1 Tax=Eucyclogobius newberryi TaxID=166745 RepID=UPI003B5CAE2A